MRTITVDDVVDFEVMASGIESGQELDAVCADAEERGVDRATIREFRFIESMGQSMAASLGRRGQLSSVMLKRRNNAIIDAVAVAKRGWR